MNQEEIISVIAEIVEENGENIHIQSNLEDIGWDSLSDLELVSIADKKWNKRVDTSILANATLVSDLVNLLLKDS